MYGAKGGVNVAVWTIFEALNSQQPVLVSNTAQEDVFRLKHLFLLQLAPVP